METTNWLKSKGYLHLSAQIDVSKNTVHLLNKIQDKKFVAQYGFYPLIHSIIKERKYKKFQADSNIRAHSYRTKSGEIKKTAKSRPLHYASHIDALIFGYYADNLQELYINKLKENGLLNDSVIAYRKIPIVGSDKNKGTIHFANEVFSEVRKRAQENSECCVLTFDIKSFFSSINHDVLKDAWSKLLDLERLPKDHFSVFKASTAFSYVMKDDLRMYKKRHGRRAGFNEKKLAKIRNRFGVNSFFESPSDFRNAIKSGELRIHKFPFHNEFGEPIGIPQGLPISAVLANLYLLNFDNKIVDELVIKRSCYYRRYSDDIIIICSESDREFVKTLVSAAILESKVEISVEKTETFQFKTLNNITNGFDCIKILADGNTRKAPLIYLGFEFNGKNILIKSANLAKFYRRMILAVKKKSIRAIKQAEVNPSKRPVVYRRQLYKLYSILDLDKTKVHTRWKRLIKTDKGYKLITGKKSKILRSNYFSYVKRASEIMNEPKIENQIRKHRHIFNETIKRNLVDKLKKGIS